MKAVYCCFLFVLSLTNVSGLVVTANSAQEKSSAAAMKFVGRWRVKFTMGSSGEKNLIFDARVKGSGSFLLLDTGPDNNPVIDPSLAVWSALTNDRVSFAGDVELPLGTCCREIGTLMFKGKFTSTNSISGKLVFVTSVDDEESPLKLHSRVGTFIATRAPE